ncbi:unnamed protein product [Closterium sp. Naga37s-1]|nr:unnamed protein product [Closterium sp. Naga37s-1]
MEHSSWVDTSTIPGYRPPYSASCSEFSCDGVADGRQNPASFVWQPFPPCSYQLWRSASPLSLAPLPNRMQPRVLLERYRNSVIAFVGDSLNDNLVASFRCTLAAVTPFQVRPALPGAAAQVTHLSAGCSTIPFPAHSAPSHPSLPPLFFPLLPFPPLLSPSSPVPGPVRWQHVRVRVGGRRYRNAVELPAYSLTVVTIASGKLTRLVNSSSARVRVDGQWAAILPLTAAMVFTAGHRFFHQVCCSHAATPAILLCRTSHPTPPNYMSPVLKLRKSLKAVRDYIERTNYPGVPLFVSYSPAHDRTQCKTAGTPLNNITAAIQGGDTRAMAVLKEQRKLLARSRMRLVEITYMSMLRPDGHLNRAVSGRRKDCSHWCLPGVPDAWSDAIYSMLVP